MAVTASVAWGYYEGGFEPWIVALLGIVGIVANSELLPFVGRKMRVLTPEQKIAARDKWRPEFEGYFLETAKNGYVGDTIIHDVGRLDTYPNSGDEKGISSWFRVGLMGTYHKGILLGLRWTYLKEKEGGWVENSTGEEDGSIKVMLLGEVPYECIESVNFDGDDFYNKPHIYCHFDFQGEPYERLFYGEQFQLNAGLRYHYRELAEYDRNPSRRRSILSRRSKK
nr:hypothetical protein [uncultured Ruegeria sp.]